MVLPFFLTRALGWQEPHLATPRQQEIPPRPSWEASNSSFIHSIDTYTLPPQQYTHWGAPCSKVLLSQSGWRGASRAHARWEEATTTDPAGPTAGEAASQRVVS